jgi:DNA-binding NtrC family response regulator
MQEVDLSKPAPQVYEIPDELLESTRKRVLILEDDAAFAAGLKETLESASYRVTVVPTGAEGVQQIIACEFDAIVCDMVMPNFPGDMFYRAVQQSRPHLCKRFVFITGHQGNPKVVEFIKQTGCVGLWKPFDMGQLFDALGSVMGAK